MNRRRSDVLRSIEELDMVVEGQQERSILPKSKHGYMSKCKVITEVLAKNAPENIIEEAFVLENGIPKKHIGEAKHI